MSADNYILIKREDKNKIMLGGHYWAGYITNASTDKGSICFSADSLTEAIYKAKNIDTEYGYRVEDLDEHIT